jgi:hypothetical protein
MRVAWKTDMPAASSTAIARFQRTAGASGNGKHRFRRVGDHPVFHELARATAEIGYEGTGMGWDPFVFVDHCEELIGRGGAEEENLRRAQRSEWELLFDQCFRKAVGAAGR